MIMNTTGNYINITKMCEIKVCRKETGFTKKTGLFLKMYLRNLDMHIIQFHT